jgi:hypothetical protein
MQAEPHSSYVTFEAPNLVFWHLIGRVEASDIMRIYEEQLEFAEGKPFLFLLADVTRLEHITAEARRVAAEGPTRGKKMMHVRAAAVIGASFHIRVIGVLIAKASRLIHRGEEMEVYFCDTEADARAWIAARAL